MGQSVRGTRIGRRGHAAALCLHHLRLPGAVPSTYRPHLTEFVRADTLPFAMVSFRGAPSELNMRVRVRVRVSLSLRLPFRGVAENSQSRPRSLHPRSVLCAECGFSQEPW